ARSRIKQREEFGEFFTQSCGSGDGKGLAPPAHTRIEQKVRQTSIMVAMKMRDDDIVDLIMVDRLLLKRRERSSPQVQQNASAWALQQKTAMIPPATREGIATTDNF